MAAMSSVINLQDPTILTLLSSLHLAYSKEVIDLISYLHVAVSGECVLPFHQRYELVLFTEMVNNAFDGKLTDIFKPHSSHMCCNHGEDQVVSVEILESSLDIVPNEAKDPMAIFVADLITRFRDDFMNARTYQNEQPGDMLFQAWVQKLLSILFMAIAGTPITLLEDKRILVGVIQTMYDLLSDMNWSPSLDTSHGESSVQVHGDVAKKGSPLSVDSELCHLGATMFDRLESGILTLDPQHQLVLAALMERSHEHIADFVTRMDFQPLYFLRLIDCQASLQQGKVILVDWSKEMGYIAVSHTYGMEVYGVFDCQCASEYHGAYRPRCNPSVNCSAIGDQHIGERKDGKAEHSMSHKKVVGDILRMCEILLEHRMSRYVWHDGVCIAQFDAVEVEETIKHMGWIYSNAFETVIFLHYVGSPMAPIRPDGDLVARWHTRVWTLQEAVLSQKRSYCVRLGHNLIGDHGIRRPGQTFTEFKANLATWYEEGASTVCVLDENRFLALIIVLTQAMPESYFANGGAGKGEGQSEETSVDTMVAEQVQEFLTDLCGSSLPPPYFPKLLDEWLDTLPSTHVLRDIKLFNSWRACLDNLYDEVVTRALYLPDLEGALEICSHRKSKHEGDRINSIMALAEVRDFTVDKDQDLEGNTIEFLRRQGKKGLATAVFLTNVTVMLEEEYYEDMDNMSPMVRTDEGLRWAYTRKRDRTWVPNLSLSLRAPEIAGMGKQILDCLSDGKFTGDCWQRLENVSFEVVENFYLRLSGHWSILDVELSYIGEKRHGDGMLSPVEEVEAEEDGSGTLYCKQPEEYEREEGVLLLELIEQAGTDAFIVHNPASLQKLGHACFPRANFRDVSACLACPLLPREQDGYFYVPMESSTLAILAFSHNDDPCPPTRALLLQHSDLSNPVAKLGTLCMERGFHDLLQTAHIPTRHIDSFVIC